MSQNPVDLPSTLNAPPRYFGLGDATPQLCQPANQTLLTTTVITTASTSATPFGFATAAQADKVVSQLNTITAALYAVGILKTITTPLPTT